MKPSVKLDLAIDDINIIGAALRKMPWEIVDPLIRKIDDQIRTSLDAQPQKIDQAKESVSTS